MKERHIRELKKYREVLLYIKKERRKVQMAKSKAYSSKQKVLVR